MQKYIGVKSINAKPMTRLEYNQFRGWTLPPDENGNDEGFLVEYVDGGQANTAEFHGYVSWSPKDVFEKAYRPIKNLDFGTVIELLKRGKKLTRSGWNGRRRDGSPMYVFMVNGSRFKVSRAPLNTMFEEGTEISYKPHLDMCHADDSIGVWVPVLNDVLAEDWQIVE